LDNETQLDVEDFEIETTFTRSLQSSSLSFALSLIVHLTLFLVLTLLLIPVNSNGLISLEIDSVEDLGSMLAPSVTKIEFDEVTDAEALELNEEELEVELEDIVLPEEFMADLSAMEEFQIEDFEEFEVAEGQVGDPNGSKNGEGSGNSSGTGFFGIEATGNRVVYLIDMSPSMQKGYGTRRFDRAVDEVIKSVDELEPDQEFLVVLFCFRMYPMNIVGPGKYCKPTKENKAKLTRWLYSAGLDSGTDPREAIVATLNMNPSCCFLLSDGEFNGRRYRNGRYGKKISAVVLASKHNLHNCPIHTIGLEDRGNQKVMTQIAENSGGNYKFVPALDGK